MTTAPSNAPANDLSEAFLRFHDAYLDAWRIALDTGDATGIEPYYRGVRSVQYARTGRDALEPVSIETNLEGIRQTVSALRGYRHTITDRAVLARDEHEVVTFFRKTIENDERRFAAFMMQVWRRMGDEGEWTLVRETIEK